MGMFAPAIPYIAGALTVASGVVTAKSYRDAGKAQAQQYAAEAVQEGDAARQREIDRRRNLLRAISSQAARAAAGGAQFSGSLGNIAQSDIEQARTDLQVDNVNTIRKTRALRAGAKESARAGAAQANISLLDTATKTYKEFG